MKVKNLFINIDRDKLAELADVDSYWARANSLVEQTWEQDVTTLTERQGDFLARIDEDLAKVCGQ